MVSLKSSQFRVILKTIRSYIIILGAKGPKGDYSKAESSKWNWKAQAWSGPWPGFANWLLMWGWRILVYPLRACHPKFIFVKLMHTCTKKEDVGAFNLDKILPCLSIPLAYDKSATHESRSTANACALLDTSPVLFPYFISTPCHTSLRWTNVKILAQAVGRIISSLNETPCTAQI